MNILVFSWRDIGSIMAGGAEQVDHEHHKGWVAAGHSVTLFSSSFPGAKSQENIDGVEIIRKGSQYLTCHISAFFWYLFQAHKKFDLVVDEFHGWPFFTPLYIKEPKLAVIQEVTREVWFKYPLPYGLNYVLGGIGYLLEPLFFLPYKNVKFMTGSESARKELQTVGINSKNVRVVSHGVILDIPKKLPKKEARETIIFLGALAKDKGIEDAIKTFGVLNRFGDYVFWVVGKGDPDYLKFLGGLAKNNNVTVKFWGFVSQKEKFELLARAHVMINPSIREGWGLVNIEANACGVPVVAYNSPGLIDSVKNGVSGIIIKKNTPDELANEVVRIFEDKGLYMELQKGALQWSRMFSWEKSRSLSIALIEEIALQ